MGAPLKASHNLLDFLLKSRGISSDAELARQLELMAPHISKIRNGALPVSSDFILRVHERFGMKVKDIRALLPEAEIE